MNNEKDPWFAFKQDFIELSRQELFEKYQFCYDTDGDTVAIIAENPDTGYQTVVNNRGVEKGIRRKTSYVQPNHTELLSWYRDLCLCRYWGA